LLHAEEAGLLEPEQQGSRPAHRVDFCAAAKVALMDDSQQQRHALCWAFMDNEKCYDRMPHNITSLALQHLGVPKEPIVSMFSTLQQMVHKISSAYGISEEEFGGIWQELEGEPPFARVLQGNGAGPALWGILSSVLF
jgi:hypothetical protein